MVVKEQKRRVQAPGIILTITAVVFITLSIDLTSSTFLQLKKNFNLFKT